MIFNLDHQPQIKEEKYLATWMRAPPFQERNARREKRGSAPSAFDFGKKRKERESCLTQAFPPPLSLLFIFFHPLIFLFLSL